MSVSNEPQVPQVADLDELGESSIDGWMSALAASPAPSPRHLPTAIVLRRARLEALLASQRAQTRRALRPALFAEAVGVLSTAVVGVYLCSPPGEPAIFEGLGDMAILAGFSSSGTVITLLVMLLLLFWFVGDEPALAS